MQSDIIIKPSIIQQENLYGILHKLGDHFAIITDDNVKSLYAENILNQLLQAGIKAELFSFPAGEQFKTRNTKEKIENQLLKAGFDRNSIILAIGGGIVSDLAGFIAATYLRGIKWAVISTSLMGMVDAAIGGKTGVNTSYGKNMVGAFHLPEIVIIDPDTLQTLDKTTYRNAFSEIIKYGCIANKQLLIDLMDDCIALHTIINQSVDIKVAVTTKDLNESSFRSCLNFGHSVAHAIEFLSQYQIPHGLALAVGLIVESHICEKIELISIEELNMIKRCIDQYFPSLPLDLLSDSEQLYLAMKRDKKSTNNEVRISVITKLGGIDPNRITEKVSLSLFQQVIGEVLYEASDKALSH